MSIPELYTDQGYGQLKLFIGHLKLKDDAGDLIITQISHLELQIGSVKPFFSLPYNQYAKWIDHTWLTSIWKHMPQVNIVVEVEDHWVPKLAHTSDIMIMDAALTYNFPPTQLKQINRCGLYLQILMMLDLTTANGKQILPNVVEGYREKQRISSLHWPDQRRPPAQDWVQW
jgi:hypothetical protein